MSNDNIRALRKALDLTQSEFGRKIGVSRNVINNLELGRVEPSDLIINMLCKTYNVNAAWLRTGEGEMFMEKSREEEIADFVGRSLADDSDGFKAQFISILAQLDEDGWKALERVSEALLEAERKAKAKYGESGDREV